MGCLLVSDIFMNPDIAVAKGPITQETIDTAFQSVRDELESPDGGIKQLKLLIQKSDYNSILDFAKEYDQSFRKAKMGKARKLITSKEDKERALYLSNAVTFDLIGMNRGCREGKQNIDEVQKYFIELENDVRMFLELEKGVDLSVLAGN